MPCECRKQQPNIFFNYFFGSLKFFTLIQNALDPKRRLENTIFIEFIRKALHFHQFLTIFFFSFRNLQVFQTIWFRSNSWMDLYHKKIDWSTISNSRAHWIVVTILCEILINILHYHKRNPFNTMRATIKAVPKDYQMMTMLPFLMNKFYILPISTAMTTSKVITMHLNNGQWKTIRY